MHLHLHPVLLIVAAEEERGREIKLRAMGFPLRFLSSLSLCLLALLLHRATVTSGCFSMEREALLDFKAGIHDTHNRLSSWVGQDCCAWAGVICRATTGHVFKLDLRNTNTLDGALRGERMNSSLLALSHLRHLDLSFNDFSGIRIPEFIGSFKKLRYLNLSSTYFMGGIPARLGNLSSLYVLDLSDALYVDDYGDGYPVDNLDWLSHLTSLKHLDLSGLNLTGVPDWFSSVNMLPSLQVLSMSSVGLDTIPASVVHVNFTYSLTVLDLSFNSFSSTLPKWLGNVSGLTSLGLSSSDFRGTIPDAIGDLSSLTFLNLGNNFLLEGIVPRSMANLRRLKELDLSVNQLSGTLTGWLEQLTNLIVLNLSYNLFNGSVPASVGKFSNLTGLYLGGNSLGGVISEAHFESLTKLRVLDLFDNSITVSIGQSWVPPFQLRVIYLSNCHLGPQFPEWLRFQTQTQELTMHDCKIAATIPNWFWNFSSSTVTLVDLSDNRIGGRLPSSLSFARLEELYLDSNIFEGPLPAMLPSALDTLYLSNNSFTGQLPVWPHVSLALLSNNMLDGDISSSICRWTYLRYLVLSGNNLFGEIPYCLGESLQNLSILSLANNHFSGEIPNTIGFLTELKLLQLKNNSFSGELPLSLQNCTNLQFLDLAQNNFVGSIPLWMGENLSQLAVLRLRSNMFSGDIPWQLAQLGRLQILDLANNNFSGSIPHNFGNFSTMASTSDNGTFIYDLFDISTKGQDLFYIKDLDLLKTLDLSNNRLIEEILMESETLQDSRTSIYREII
ncbi:receptor-like protein EIX2 [Musa acuminata AAA Group]|uniref:receptor-like protein EIX2 n=1 Tax=Musa acuminata AAA Group TaxID=214697 RepID=UPI0031D511AF